MSLDAFFQAQNQPQVGAMKSDVSQMTTEERVKFIAWNVQALVDEAHEALGEVGWKPWASSRHLNAEAVLGEIVDAFHFLMNIGLAAGAEMGLTAEETGTLVGVKYFAKRKVNADRQRDGYDGVSSKCPSCKRELSEVPVATLELGCCGCGKVLAPDVRMEALRGRR